MKILVFGASGRTGQHIVSQALEKGHQVTAFVRDPSKLSLEDQRLRIVCGNVADYENVQSAIKGQDAVLSALGASSPFKFDQVVVNGIRNIIIAMEQSGTRRLIYLSFIGVRESRGDAPLVIRYLAPLILRTEIAGHESREKMIVDSRLAWTIVRPSGLSSGPKKSIYRFGEDLKSRAFMVNSSREDVADFMLRLLNDDQYLKKKPRIMN